jgi:hypothetical protein
MKKIELKTILNLTVYTLGFEMFIFSFKIVSFQYFFLSFLIFLIAIYRDFIKYFKINRTLLNIIALIFVILIFLRVTLQDIITPALESLIVLLSIKFLEDKEKRDYLQIFLISILIFTGATIFSFEIFFLFYFIFFIFLINFSIIFLTYFSEDKNLEFTLNEIIKISKRVILIPLIALPFSLLLFFALPRTPNPIFSFFGSTLTARTGFSETVKLGNVSEIQEDNSIIFRATMEKLNDDDLYFRGLTLNFYENNEWSYIKTSEDDKRFELKGKIIEQTIYLEPYSGNYLFGLDKPIAIYSFIKFEKEDFTYKTKEIISNRIKYVVKSIISDFIYQEKVDKVIYLSLPKNLTSKFYEFAKKIDGENKFEVAKKILNYLLSGEFKYSLKNLPISENPVEDFLFKTKEGNCEYFATSMALLLRAVNIPSRVVAGYKGGLYNDLGGYYIIRQSDAHLWVEAYFEGIGWLRFDPTPSSQRDYLLLKTKIVSKLRLFLDTLNYYYNTFIINYDLEKQISILNKLRDISINTRIKFRINFQKIKDFIDLKILIIIFSIISSIYLIFKKFRFNKNSYEVKIINMFYKKLKKLDLKKEKNEGLEEFLNKVENEKIRNVLKNFILKFEEIYYKDKKLEKRDYLYFKKLIQNI